MILLLLASIALIELARRLPVFQAVGAMSACSAHAMRLLRRRGASDWSKQRAMRILSRRLFLRSAYAGGVLLLVASPLLLLLALTVSNPALAGMRLDDWGLRLWVLPFTVGYALLRWRVGHRIRSVQPR